MHKLNDESTSTTEKKRKAYSVTSGIKTVSESNRREHWGSRAARVKKQRNAAHAAVRAIGFIQYLESIVTGKVQCPVTFEITLTRIAPRKLDDDNLRGALKAVRDGVADALGFVDDSDDALTWKYGQEKGRPREYAVRIDVVQS